MIFGLVLMTTLYVSVYADYTRLVWSECSNMKTSAVTINQMDIKPMVLFAFYFINKYYKKVFL